MSHGEIRKQALKLRLSEVMILDIFKWKPFQNTFLGERHADLSSNAFS